MTSPKQVQANRENARLSTGPRTEEGKERTARNAIKHGFRAKEPLIPGEDPEEFTRHGAELVVEFAPISVVEQNLVEQLIDITWRLKRFGRIEAAIINDLFDKAAEQEGNQDKDGEQLLGNALSDSHALNRLSRYEAQLARRYHNTMKELREVQKRRRRGLALSGLRSSQADEPEASERTHSVESHLESIMKAAKATVDGCLDVGPPPPPDDEIHPDHSDDLSHQGNKEAAA